MLDNEKLWLRGKCCADGKITLVVPIVLPLQVVGLYCADCLNQIKEQALAVLAQQALGN